MGRDAQVMEFQYKVRESTIVVRGRPKQLTAGGEHFTGQAPEGFDAFLCVTDTFIVAPPGKILMWFPWNEDRKPIPELYYACNRALNWWTHYEKLKNIMVFCDAGTRRSVTVFGAFLMTYFDKTEREKIVQERIALKKYDYADAQLATYADPLSILNRIWKNFRLTVYCFAR
jgi:hypothetical protein